MQTGAYEHLPTVYTHRSPCSPQPDTVRHCTRRVLLHLADVRARRDII